MNRALRAAWIATAIATISFPSAAAAAGKPTPAPAPVPAIPASNPEAAPGYFLMQGSRIASKPYANERACQKALKEIKRDMQPGSDTLVCAHRRP